MRLNASKCCACHEICIFSRSQNAARATKSAFFRITKCCACHEICIFQDHKGLRLPRNLHFEVHKALRAPRNLHFSGSQNAARATKSAFFRITKGWACHAICTSRFTKHCTCHDICTSRLTSRNLDKTMHFGDLEVNEPTVNSSELDAHPDGAPRSDTRP